MALVEEMEDFALEDMGKMLVYAKAIVGEGWFRLLSSTSGAYGSCTLEKLFRVIGRDSLDRIVLQISQCGEQVLDLSLILFSERRNQHSSHYLISTTNVFEHC